MPTPIQSRTRTQIRQDIGAILGDVIVGTATATVDTSSLQDTYGLVRGGDNEYRGRQVIIITPTGSIVAGEKSFVASSVTTDATVAPVFTAAITDGDIYEMWKVFLYEEINKAINQAIMEVTNDCLQIKQTTTTFTDSQTYEYDALSSFVGLHKVEWVFETKQFNKIHDCDTVWDELVDGDVTATRDTTLVKEGNASLKLVVAAGAGAGDILATEDISSADLTQDDQLEVWIYSSVALDAGDLQVLLDNTAQCASPLEELDIPATTANTWTRHIISLANPSSDSAIISVGIKMVTDKGAFTLYVDDIKTVASGSRIYKTLNPDYWSIVRDTTNYLKLSLNGLSVVGTPKQLRLTGYQLPALLTADTGTSEIDPSWIIAFTVARLMMGHAKSSRLDINDRATRAKEWSEIAESKMTSIRTLLKMDTKWI